MGDDDTEEEGAQLAQDIQRRLAESAEPATRAWYEERAHLGRWRGNKSEASQRAVFAAVEQRTMGGGEEELDGEEEGDGGGTALWEGGIRWGGGVARYYAAMELMRSVYSDDKLAGAILFQVRVIVSPDKK